FGAAGELAESSFRRGFASAGKVTGGAFRQDAVTGYTRLLAVERIDSGHAAIRPWRCWVSDSGEIFGTWCLRGPGQGIEPCGEVIGSGRGVVGGVQHSEGGEGGLAGGV